MNEVKRGKEGKVYLLPRVYLVIGVGKRDERQSAGMRVDHGGFGSVVGNVPGR
jgi:hypothetical protein